MADEALKILDEIMSYARVAAVLQEINRRTMGDILRDQAAYPVLRPAKRRSPPPSQGEASDG